LDRQKDNDNQTGIQDSMVPSRCVSIVLCFALSSVIDITHSNPELVDQFDSIAEEVLHISKKNAAHIVLGIQTMASLFPAIAHENGQILPFASFQDYEAFGSGTRQITRATLIAYTPFLSSDLQLAMWSAFMVNHTDWIPHGRDFSLLNEHVSVHPIAADEPNKNGNQTNANGGPVDDNNQDSGPDQSGDKLYGGVFYVDENGSVAAESGNGPFAPVWMTSPVPTDTESVINLNLARYPTFRSMMTYVQTTSHATLSEPLPVQQMFGNSNNIGTACNETRTIPHSILLQPVYSAFEKDTNADGKRTVIGGLAAVVAWDAFFDEVSRRLSLLLVVVPGRTNGFACA
jgi:hypothetical protein